MKWKHCRIAKDAAHDLSDAAGARNATLRLEQDLLQIRCISSKIGAGMRALQCRVSHPFRLQIACKYT